MIKLNTGVQSQVKNKLSNTLKSWLPILQANISKLEEIVNEHKYENPFIEVESGFENRDAKVKKGLYEFSHQRYSSQENIEKLTIDQESFYDKIDLQIDKPIFPTEVSQKVAREIVRFLDEDGYFDGDIDAIAQGVWYHAWASGGD